MTDSASKPAVILVADRTLCGDYKILFEGIFATMQTSKVPRIAYERFLSPAIKTDRQGNANVAPIGLRRIQAALIDQTDLSADQVVVTTPERLGSLLGPWVKIVAVSSSDPLGMGMSNTTTTSFWAGRLYTRYYTRSMLSFLADQRQKYGFKIVFGGAGAWQFRCHADPLAEEIDLLFEGFFEQAGPQIFSDILAGGDFPSHYSSFDTSVENVRPIIAPTSMGIVEFSRGCGRGCSFCTMSNRKMNHLPPETILEDIRTNLRGGIRTVVSGSEDFFRYGSAGLKPDCGKLIPLLERIRAIDGLSFMQIDHGNIATIMQLDDSELKMIRKLLAWNRRVDYLWVNMGIESANGHLVAANCPGKISPYDPENWSQMVLETAHKMTRCGFFPVFSLILGLPGETPDDIEATIELVDRLEKLPVVVFPIFHEPQDVATQGSSDRFTVSKMSMSHLDLYRKCYEINFRRVPALFWDNQRAAGVSLIKRATLRLLGKTEVVAWRRNFARIERRILDRTETSVKQESANV